MWVPVEKGPDNKDLVVYHDVAKHMVWRRLLGDVRKYIVVEAPLI